MIGDRWDVDLEPAEQLGLKTVKVDGRDDVVNWIQAHLK